MRPLVSILIPAYNAEKWIADTMRSALAQTWEPKEIVVVDDGSTDRTPEIAQQFASETVRVVSQENQGGPGARNKAFSLSRGDYIQWLDHDDLLAPDKIARQLQLLESGVGTRTLLSGSFGLFFNDPQRARFSPTPLWNDLSPKEFLLRKMEHDVYMQTGVWLVSRELTEAAGPWDTTMLTDDDGEYFCRVLNASDGIRFVPEAKAYWRISGIRQASYTGWSDRKLEARAKAMELFVNYMRPLGEDERTRTACLTYLQNNLIYFYSLRPDLAQQMQDLAAGLGGRLEAPRFSWKYSWIKTLFGWNWARRAQLLLPSFRSLLVRSWDKAMTHSQKTKAGA